MSAAKNPHLDTKFCCICNSRFFADFNDRKLVKCAVCGSLERHRSFGFFLLSHVFDPEPKMCIISRSAKVPKYVGFLSRLIPVTVMVEEAFARKKGAYDIVYHDHILHGSDTFLGHQSYQGLIEEIDGIVKPGGIQAFSVGSLPDMAKIYSPTLGKGAGVKLYPPLSYEEEAYQSEAVAFDPRRSFGNEVLSCGVLGGFPQHGRSGHLVVLRQKG